MPLVSALPFRLAISASGDTLSKFRSKTISAGFVLAFSSTSLPSFTNSSARPLRLAASLSLTEKNRSFEHLPDNVRLLVTARSGRLDQLQLPNYFHKLEIAGFNRYETAQHVQAIWANAPESWIDDFHYHSHGNPRVQRYALGLKKDQPEESLAVLLPGGKVLSDVFRIQLDDAR